MVAFTAASQLGPWPAVGSASHTLDQTYPGIAPTQVVNSLQPDDRDTAATWSGLTARTGYGGEGAGRTTNHALDQTYPGIESTQVVNGLQPDSHTGAGTWSGPIALNAVIEQTDAAQHSLDHTLGQTYIGFEPTQVVTGWDAAYTDPLGEQEYQANRGSAAGSLIPTKFFRTVSGTVVDENGTAISDAMYVVALDNFATAGKVRGDGTFQIYLLRQRYQDFVLIVDANEAPDKDGGEVEYMWYELGNSPDVGVYTDDVTLQFDRTTVNKGSGQSPGLTAMGMRFG